MPRKWKIVADFEHAGRHCLVVWVGWEFVEGQLRLGGVDPDEWHNAYVEDSYHRTCDELRERVSEDPTFSGRLEISPRPDLWYVGFDSNSSHETAETRSEAAVTERVKRFAESFPGPGLWKRALGALGKLFRWVHRS